MDIIAQNSARLEFITWKDQNGEDNYAYLLMHGTQREEFEKAIDSGEVDLDKFGLFYKGKGTKPTKEEIKILREILSEGEVDLLLKQVKAGG